MLVGLLRYSARQAVPLNLAISLVTLAIALVTRSRTLSFAALIRFLPALGALIAGAVITAFIGPAFASRLSEERLERVILVFLVCIGLALMIEGLLPQTLPGFLPDTLPWHIGAGVIFGLAIGLVSSLPGVAGGELLSRRWSSLSGQTSRRQGQAVSLSASQLSLWGCFGMRAVGRLLTAKP